MKIVVGEPDSAQYRSRRLEVLLCAVTGRFITFDELDLVRRERKPATRYRLENLTSPNAVGDLIHSRLAAHVEFPQAIRDAMPTIGLSMPRLRSL